MATTTNRDYFYPGIDEAPAGPFAFEQLAVGVDADVHELFKGGRGAIAHVEQSELAIGYSGTPTTANLVAADLVAGHWYSARYRFNAISAGTSSFAVGVYLKKSAVAVTDATGTDVENGHTVYTAPTANQGISHAPEFIWQASATETVNLKAVLARLSGVATFDIESRRLVVVDLGTNLP